MLDLTSLDYIYIGVIVASTIWATVRGGIYETVATLSWVIAAFAARLISPTLDTLLQGWFNLSESTVGTLVSSYFIVFFVILLLVGFFNQKLRDWIQHSIMNVTDHTLGVIFGIVRGIVVMGAVYWVALWYYSDAPKLPHWIADARMRPIMQLTAVKLDQWFVPGAENKLLARDMTGTRESTELLNIMINTPVRQVQDVMVGLGNSGKNESDGVAANDTGYKSSERTALENQLLQIETAARAEEGASTDDDE